MYDKASGAPIHAQDVRAATDQEANISTLPWKEWLRGSFAKRSGEQPTHMAAIQLVFNSLHTRGHIDQAPLDDSIDQHTKRKVVKSSEDLSGGSLALPPCVPHASRVYDKSWHQHLVPIKVTERSAVADRKPDTRVRGKAACEPSQSSYYLRASRVHYARREQGYN